MENGDTYTGSFKADMMSGKGKKVYQDGIIYEGEWSSGVYVGTGVLSWPNKNKYEENLLPAFLQAMENFTVTINCFLKAILMALPPIQQLRTGY